MKIKNGFSLIELMITVAVVGILASIAYPSYTNYVQRAKRSAAQEFMMDMSSKQERYRLDMRGYTSTIGTGGLGLGIPSEVSDNYILIMAVSNAAAPPTFTITANPKAGSVMAGTASLTLDNNGQKTPIDEW